MHLLVTGINSALEKHGSAKFHVDVKKVGGGGEGSNLNFQWTSCEYVDGL